MSATLIFAFATAGWNVTKTADGCTYLKGSEEGSVTPIRVECEWSDVDAGKMHRLLGRPGSHDGVFGGLAQADVVQEEGALTRVYQRFAARGMSDREVVVDYRTTSVDGGKRYRWRKSSDQSALHGDAMELPDTSGSWQVTENNGKVQLVYELRLKLGGMVPTFAVNWAQTSAIQDTINELKEKVLAD